MCLYLLSQPMHSFLNPTQQFSSCHISVSCLGFSTLRSFLLIYLQLSHFLNWQVYNNYFKLNFMVPATISKFSNRNIWQIPPCAQSGEGRKDCQQIEESNFFFMIDSYQTQFGFIQSCTRGIQHSDSPYFNEVVFLCGEDVMSSS